MGLTAYITSIKEQLSALGDNPVRVLDGPFAFTLNNYSDRNFICVSETIMEYVPSDSLTMYSYPINLEIGIHTEKAPADREAKHLTRARIVYELVWAALGGMKVGGFQIVRTDSERLETDDTTMVEYVIRCRLEVKQLDGSC